MVRVAVDIVCMGRDETSVKTWQILELAVFEQTDDLSLYPPSVHTRPPKQPEERPLCHSKTFNPGVRGKIGWCNE